MDEVERTVEHVDRMEQTDFGPAYFSRKQADA